MIIDTDTIVPAGFIPAQINDGFGIFVLPILICPVCSLPILNISGVMMSGESVLREAIQRQLYLAGWRLPSNVLDSSGRVICNIDALAYNQPTTFSCFSCGLSQPVNALQLSFGTINPSFLCQACYSRLPAKQWNEMVALLASRHVQDPPAPIYLSVATLVTRTATLTLDTSTSMAYENIQTITTSSLTICENKQSFPVFSLLRN